MCTLEASFCWEWGQYSTYRNGKRCIVRPGSMAGAKVQDGISQEPVRSSIDLSIIKRLALAINKAGLSGNGFQSDRANRKHAQELKSESISD